MLIDHSLLDHIPGPQGFEDVPGIPQNCRQVREVREFLVTKLVGIGRTVCAFLLQFQCCLEREGASTQLRTEILSQIILQRLLSLRTIRELDQGEVPQAKSLGQHLMHSALLVFKFFFLRVLNLLVGLHPGVSDTALLISDDREDPVLH
jgi:hypothetical protein